MALLLNEYPYSDYQKINLDWLLDLGNKLKADAESGAFNGEQGERGYGVYGGSGINITSYSESIDGTIVTYPYTVDKIYVPNAVVNDFILGTYNNLVIVFKATNDIGSKLVGFSALTLTGPQGEQGEQGEPGEVTQAEFDELSGEVGDLKSALGNFVTPETYGAKGDGVTDDSDALNSLFLSTEKNILIPGKTYYCAKNITLGVNGKSIFGAGRYSSVIMFASDCGFTLNASRATISDVQFYGGNGVTSNGYHVSWLNCLFTKSNTGITINNGYINQFTSCYFLENGLGIILNNQSYETVFQSCVIDNNTVGVIVSGGSAGPVFKDCTIEGNSDRTSKIGCGIYICASLTRLIIDGCFFEANGSDGHSADIISQSATTVSPATDISDLYTVIDSVYAGDKNYVGGQIVISNNRFYLTPYAIITGGSKANFDIHNNDFIGLADNKPIAILINGANLLDNEIHIKQNVLRNVRTGGVKNSYIFTDIVPSESQYDSLINGVVFLDEYPLFVYRGRFEDFTGSKVYPKIKSTDGESHEWGIINGSVTNCYTGATATVFVSPDGTNNNLFSAANIPLTFIAIVNNTPPRANTVGTGWRVFRRKAVNLFPINRYSIQTRYLLGNNDTIVFAFIELSADDIAKTKQCLAFEPTDLAFYEFR